MTMTQGIGARAQAVRAGVRLELLTILWMVVEAAVAIGAGILARSVLLTAFGFDSVIELLSAGVLLWRLSVEANGNNAEWIAHVEHRATWASAVLLVLLCLYVVATSVFGLLSHVQPERSWLGIAVSLGALVIMPLLTRAKRRINQTLESSALRADIAESLCCSYLAATTLGGVLLTAVLGLWWIEYVAAVVLLYYLVRETREALEAVRTGKQDACCTDT